jgi:phospholipase C
MSMLSRFLKGHRPGMALHWVFVLPMIVVTGCGSGVNTAVVNLGPAVTLTANPTVIVAGTASMLSISASNAAAVAITGSDGSRYVVSATGGTQSVTPASTTTYTATATVPGASATATVTITVTPVPPSVTLTANPTSVAAGGISTLTATSTAATSLVITGSDSSRYTLSASGGTQTVTPAATTSYTATVTGPGGVTTAIATVVLNAPPSVTLSASPMSIQAGGTSILTLSAANATSLVVTGSDGSRYVLPSAGGTQAVSPSLTTIYTAIASGPGGRQSATVTVTVLPGAPTVMLNANPTSISAGGTSTLTATATNASTVVITGSDGSRYSLSSTGGTQSVSPTTSTTYTATSTGAGGSSTSTAAVNVVSSIGQQAITHVIFELQENHSFDSYFGMLNPYRVANHMSLGDDGKTYAVDGLDDKLSSSNVNDEGTAIPLFKLKSTCVQDMTSSWLESYGDVNRYDFGLNRPVLNDGFVHTAENFAKNCQANHGLGCAGLFDDFTGKVSMGYYDQGFLNYYYYMASQFALSDRWFSPISSSSIPNRIATFAGGTTQGLAFDPGFDQLPQLGTPTIFAELSANNVSWKIYYTVTQGACSDQATCVGGAAARYPATDFSYFTDVNRYLYKNPGSVACTAPTQASSVVGDSTNSFCIDPTHIAPISSYFNDLNNNTLPSFAFIEAGYGVDDEHPGSGQSVLEGQAQIAKVVNALMISSSWKNSVFFLSFDEGGGPYDHVPPVPGHSNDFTDSMIGSASVGSIPDIASIAVNPDSYFPCIPPGGNTATTHCDLVSSSTPGAHSTDAAAVRGFAAQLGFRLPNMVISPFTRRHYVSHTPMDHTAVLKFVENRFIGPNAHLTARDAAQPNLLDFFDFTAIPWATPPTPPAPITPATLGYDPCTPTKPGP